MTEALTPAVRAAIRSVHAANACRFNLDTLRPIYASNHNIRPAVLNDAAMRAACARIVRDAEAGRLSTEDSLTLAAFGVAMMRELAR